MERRLFTAEEADELLPWLRGVLQKIGECRNQINSKLEEIKPLSQKSKSNGGGRLGEELKLKQEEISELSEAANKLNEEIQHKGCILKDLDNGLVDFPSMRGGREVYLCWCLGEERVSYWHELDTGFASRQPL